MDGKQCLLENSIEADMRQTMKKMVAGYPDALPQKNMKKYAMWTDDRVKAELQKIADESSDPFIKKLAFQLMVHENPK